MGQQVIGISENYLWRYYGVFTFAQAISNKNDSLGGLGEIGFSRNTQRYSFGAKATLTSSAFTQIGLQPNQLSPSFVGTAFASYNTKKYGNFSLSYTVFNNRSYANQATALSSEILTTSYNKTIFKRIFLSLSALLNLKNRHENSYFITLSFSPGLDKTVLIDSTINKGKISSGIQLSKNLQQDTGVGYRLLANQNSQPIAEADFAWRHSKGEITTRYLRYNDINHYEVNITGGITHFSGETLLTRNIQDSFGLVSLPLTKIPVYFNNNLLGQTDSHGLLLLPNMIPYHQNKVSIHPQDIPLNCGDKNYNKIVTPYYRSGTFIHFDIVCRVKALGHLTYHHHVVPAGASVSLHGVQSDSLFVGYHGMVYFPELSQRITTGYAQWGNQRCTFKIILPAKPQAIYRLGTIICR